MSWFISQPSSAVNSDTGQCGIRPLDDHFPVAGLSTFSRAASHCSRVPILGSVTVPMSATVINSPLRGFRHWPVLNRARRFGVGTVPCDGSAWFR